jgi:hypothetical protein
MDDAMAELGYARVSTTDQHVAGQIEALKAAGCEGISAERGDETVGPPIACGMAARYHCGPNK